jgi:hypothetical protein
MIDQNTSERAARAPLAEDGVCGLEDTKIDVHVAVAERLDELLRE